MRISTGIWITVHHDGDVFACPCLQSIIYNAMKPRHMLPNTVTRPISNYTFHLHLNVHKPHFWPYVSSGLTTFISSAIQIYVVYSILSHNDKIRNFDRLDFLPLFLFRHVILYAYRHGQNGKVVFCAFHSIIIII